MRIEMTADDGRVLVFEDAGPEKFQLYVYKQKAAREKYHTPKSEDRLINAMLLKKADVKRLAKAS